MSDRVKNRDIAWARSNQGGLSRKAGTEGAGEGEGLFTPHRTH